MSLKANRCDNAPVESFFGMEDRTPPAQSLGYVSIKLIFH